MTAKILFDGVRFGESTVDSIMREVGDDGLIDWKGNELDNISIFDDSFNLTSLQDNHSKRHTTKSIDGPSILNIDTTTMEPFREIQEYKNQIKELKAQISLLKGDDKNEMIKDKKPMFERNKWRHFNRVLDDYFNSYNVQI